MEAQKNELELNKNELELNKNESAGETEDVA